MNYANALHISAAYLSLSNLSVLAEGFFIVFTVLLKVIEIKVNLILCLKVFILSF